MSLDITDTLTAKSDQLNADDLIGGPITVTITGVKPGASAEQPVDVLISDHRPWKPCKTMRRVLAHAWGTDASVWVGRRLTLYREDEVSFGGQRVGGIRVSAMSHTSGPFQVALAVSKGKKAAHKVASLAAEVRADPFAAALHALDLTVEDAADYLAAKEPPILLANMDHDARRAFVGFAKSEAGMAKIRAFLSAGGAE